MNLAGKTVLVTGGSNGIGLAIAERFLKAGSTVIICGRREEKLQEVKERFPELHTYSCDVGKEEERKNLFEQVTKDFPKVNVLVNNAGIQRRFQLADEEEWSKRQQEIAINFEAPIHLATLFLEHFQKQREAYIINVSSGLAFAPMAIAPIYCATKAAIHSFTLSLRHQLAATSIKVIEIVPPAVNTDLGGEGLHSWATPVDEFADSIMERVANGELEIGYGTSEEMRNASREEIDARFNRMNNN